MLAFNLADISLHTRVVRLLPDFRGNGKEEIEILHLLTHTSGLPDMVDNNLALREAKADLSSFYRSVCDCALRFQPGTDIGYQSMGFLVLSMLVERLSGQQFSTFLRDHIFVPSGMSASSLGTGQANGGLDVLVNLPEGQVDKSWNWNSSYWRRLGAPWGGLQSTASDVSTFAFLFVSGGESPRGSQVLNKKVIDEIRRDWTSELGVRCPPMGLGWFKRGQTDAIYERSALPSTDTTGTTTQADIVFNRGFMGDPLTSSALGHCGVTGCVMWADPFLGFSAALLTNTPAALQGELFSKAIIEIAQHVAHQ
jgi:CubicO group peptidase (beta-lactamase class C family)